MKKCIAVIGFCIGMVLPGMLRAIKFQSIPKDSELISSVARDIVEAGAIVLKSGQKVYVLPQEVASLSPMITGVLDIAEGKEGALPVIELPRDIVSPQLLPKVVTLLKDLNKAYEAGRQERKIPDLTVLARDVQQEEAVPLIKAFHYLQVKPLVALLMFRFGKQEKETKKDAQGQEIVVAEHWKVNGLHEAIQNNVNKMTFSVRELIALGQAPREVRLDNKLDLQYKKLASLDGLQEVQGLSNLVWLDLSHNKLSNLPPNIFHELGVLRGLYLSHNQLSSLPANIFQGLGQLEDLDLSYNQLSNLPKGIFERLGELKEVELSHNQLSSLPKGIFQGLGQLEGLNLSYNQLSSLPPNIFHELGQLEWLNLSYNQLSSLPANIFDGLGSLRYLDLPNNQLSSLPEDIFQGVGNLDWLDLSHNKLSSLPANIFQGLGQLEDLDLSDNPIESIKQDALSRLPQSLRNFAITYKGTEYTSISELRERLRRERDPNPSKYMTGQGD